MQRASRGHGLGGQDGGQNGGQSGGQSGGQPVGRDVVGWCLCLKNRMPRKF